MTTTLALAGTLTANRVDGERPAPRPLAFLLASYAQHVALPLEYTEAQARVAVGTGTLTAPKVVWVEVESGVLDVQWDNDAGTTPFRLSMDADPVPTSRAFLLLGTPVGRAATLYVASPAGCSATVWMFQ